jgi:pyruvate dehydrogenase E2 component (dihydrolipoamide acetyltransferase)
MADTKEVRVPDIGDFTDVEIIEVHVKAGDEIAPEDPVVTLETDKASMDVPAPAGGKVAELKVKSGDRVSEGDVLLLLKKTGSDTSSDKTGSDTDSGAAPEESESKAPSQAPEQEPLQESKSQQASPEPASSSATRPQPGAVDKLVSDPGSSVHAGPSVRKFAREMGVDLGRVKGSGVKGRITHEDVKAWVKKSLTHAAPAAAPGGAALPAVPEVDFSKFGATGLAPLSRVQRISGPRLHASWVNLPHVTQFDEADITETERVRKELKGDADKEGVKLTPLAFILRACVKALREFPQFNASLHPDGQHLVLKHYFNIGFAVDTPGGLVVPVIKGLEGKSLFQVARELGELSEKARDNKLAAADMQGGNFTVSSLGGIGGTFFTPIINAPEVAILGVSRHKMQPVWQGGEFVPRLILPLSLSYDHRVIDGATAVRFTRFLGEILSDVDRLLA